MKTLLVLAGASIVLAVFSVACSQSAAVSKSTPASGPASAARELRTYGKPTKTQLAQLTPLQREVTQHAATEPPFQNQYWDNHAVGIYVDVATGEPLFSSLDKFESGTGWPSFTRPIEAKRVMEADDLTHGMTRTEVVSSGGGSHLGHVFPDGPAPTGLRYCINSASLRFVPFASLEEEGYGEYRARFLAADGTPPPAATVNACNFPAPGQKAGCSATVAVAIVGGRCVARTRDAISKAPGVIDTTLGTDGADRAPALRVLFDPAKTSYDALVRTWIAEGGAHAEDGRVLASTSDEERIAKRTLTESRATAEVTRTVGFHDATPDDAKTGHMSAARCL